MTEFRLENERGKILVKSLSVESSVVIQKAEENEMAPLM